MEDVSLSAAALLTAEVHPAPAVADEPPHATEQEKGYELDEIDEELQKALRSQDPECSVEEQVLYQVIASEAPVLKALQEIKLKLAMRLLAQLDDANRGFCTARVMREVAAVADIIKKRQVNVVGAATNLRAQRRLLGQTKRGSNGD